MGNNLPVFYLLSPILKNAAITAVEKRRSMMANTKYVSGDNLLRVLNKINAQLKGKANNSEATTSAAGLMSAADKKKLDGVTAGANAYTHPTSSGNKHIPAGGSSGQILRWSADGTAVWGADNNTTYTHPTYTARTGKPTGNQAPGFGGTFTISQVTSDGTGHVTGMTDRTVTIPSTAATTSAAGLMSAADKTKLDGINAAGSSTQPVYFSGGKPVATTYTLGKSVPADAVFTDTKQEAYLSWGGTNLAGSISPVDAAASNLHSANRFAFAKAAGITIQYSRDGGSTWTNYGSSDDARISFVSGIGYSHYIGGHTSGITVNDKLRVTLNATNMSVYTSLRKLLINLSTSGAGGAKVLVERAMKGSESTFVTVGTYSVSGWSGWNSIPIGYAFGGSSDQTSNVAILRLTFSITSLSSTYSSALGVSDIVAIGDTYWNYNSTMAKTGHLYSYDSGQNATFPAKVTATSFVGAAATQSVAGLMSATDKTKLDGITVATTAEIDAAIAAI